MEMPEICPKCNNNKVQAIIYGLTNKEKKDPLNENKEIFFGGCIVKEKYRCPLCKHKWGEYDLVLSEDKSFAIPSFLTNKTYL